MIADLHRYGLAPIGLHNGAIRGALKSQEAKGQGPRAKGPGVL